MKYVIDIDGTIFYTRAIQKGFYNDYKIISPNYFMINKINELHEKGNIIILHTARHWEMLEKTKKQLADYKVNYTTLICGKPDGDKIIDDKAVKPEDFLKEE